MGAAEDEPSEGPPSSEEVPRVPRPWDFLSDGAPTGGPPGGPPGGPSLCSLPSCLSEGVGSGAPLAAAAAAAAAAAEDPHQTPEQQGSSSTSSPGSLFAFSSPPKQPQQSAASSGLPCTQTAVQGGAIPLLSVRLLSLSCLLRRQQQQQQEQHQRQRQAEEISVLMAQTPVEGRDPLGRRKQKRSLCVASGDPAPSPALEEDPSGCPPHPFFSAVSRYCLRVLQQAELQQQQAACCAGTSTISPTGSGRALSGDTPSSSSSSCCLRLGRCAVVNGAVLEAQLMDAAAVEAVRLLYLLAPASRDIQQQAFVAIKRRAPSASESGAWDVCVVQAAGGSFGEVCNALLDLPLTAAFLEKGLPASPRVSAVCKAVPLCLDILFKEALQAPHPQPRAELFRALLQRFSLLYPLSFFVDDFKSHCFAPFALGRGGNLVSRPSRAWCGVSWCCAFRLRTFALGRPCLTSELPQLQQRHQIVQGIRAHSNPQGAPLAEALCWAVVAEYFEALEAVAYEALAPMAPPERPTLIFESHRPPGEPLHTGFLSGGRTTLFSDATSAEGLDSHSSPKEATAALETPRAARRTGASRAALGDDRRPASIDIDLSDCVVRASDWASSEGLAAKGPPATPRAAQVASLDLPPSLICVSVAALSQLTLRFPPLRPRTVLCLSSLRAGVQGDKWLPLLSRISFSLRTLSDLPLAQRILSDGSSRSSSFSPL
ncbi:uncharacterized protein LOC34618923 [Cyclospora cayetanensis]|uniref:Uncharacterized protein LOC34618923 n=1 Tax=Cyclospora cayetanensis TaxID=88456 RepID=A0A6P6RXW8_9EIME|nr:uncharacterized protein LOC34618923 [Cyclospora cayetanensis]